MNALAQIETARLPQSYEAAKVALAQCEQIDECKDWADKAAALASYAKQAEDDTLYKTAMRIKGRAVRRYGEILKQVEPVNAARDRMAGGDLPLSRKAAATAAGLSERQMKTGLNVASIPPERFEALIERENPPTVTELAEQGRVSRPKEPPAHLGGRSAEDFNRAMHFEGKIEHYLAQISPYDIASITAALSDKERANIRALIERIDAIHDQIITRI